MLLLFSSSGSNEHASLALACVDATTLEIDDLAVLFAWAELNAVTDAATAVPAPARVSLVSASKTFLPCTHPLLWRSLVLKDLLSWFARHVTLELI